MEILIKDINLNTQEIEDLRIKLNNVFNVDFNIGLKQYPRFNVLRFYLN